jgi:hypothetical protein
MSQAFAASSVFPSPGRAGGSPFDPDRYRAGPVDPRDIEQQIEAIQAEIAEAHRVRLVGKRANQKAIPELKALIAEFRKELAESRKEWAVRLKALDAVWTAKTVDFTHELEAWRALDRVRVAIRVRTADIQNVERQLAEAEERLPTFDVPTPLEVAGQEQLAYWQARLHDARAQFPQVRPRRVMHWLGAS